MALTCIVFMTLGFIMARRYVLSRQKNAKIEEYLAYQREGRLDELTEEQALELDEIKRSVS
jgi:Na+/melibiose symporter-like transporter